jgi:hypothetical protein
LRRRKATAVLPRLIRLQENAQKFKRRQVPLRNRVRVTSEPVIVGRTPENKAIPMIDKSFRAEGRNISLKERSEAPKMANIGEEFIRRETHTPKIDFRGLEAFRE